MFSGVWRDFVPPRPSAASPSRLALLALAAGPARPAAVVLSLSAAESPPAAAIDPPPGMPAERDGVPAYYRRKRIGGARRFTHMATGETVDTPKERLSAWAAAFNRRAASGLYPFVYPRHLEAGEQPDATKTLGYVIGVDDEPDGLYARLQMLGEDGRKAAAVNGASVTITAGQDWDGEKYPEFLHHLALTPMAAHPDAAYVPTLAASGAVVMAPVYVCGPAGCGCGPVPSRAALLALSAGGGKGGGGHWVTIDEHPVFIGGDAGFVPARLRPTSGESRFTKKHLQDHLVAHHEQVSGGTGGESAGSAAEWENAGTGYGQTTFHKALPGEVKRYLEGNANARRLFRVTDDPKAAGGEDAMGDLGVDKYFAHIDQASGNKMAAAVKAAHASYDPEVKFLAHVHDNLPAGGGKNLQRIGAGGLAIGDEFKVNGERFRVAEDAGGLRVLESKHYGEPVPVDALTEIPIDKGTLRKGKSPRASAVPADGIPFSAASPSRLALLALSAVA